MVSADEQVRSMTSLTRGDDSDQSAKTGIRARTTASKTATSSSGGTPHARARSRDRSSNVFASDFRSMMRNPHDRDRGQFRRVG